MSPQQTLDPAALSFETHLAYLNWASLHDYNLYTLESLMWLEVKKVHASTWQEPNQTIPPATSTYNVYTTVAEQCQW